MIAIVDCNNFYASCERVFNPGIENKPIIVLSNNDGCVIARSNEAKAIGIKMGVPAFHIKETIEIHQVNVFSSNYTLYGDMSARVMNILHEMVPEVEVYSIDEAFLNLDGIINPEKLCAQIRSRILKYTGIPVSIGIAPTKTLAKVANKLVKKYPELCGVYLMDTLEKIKKSLNIFPVEDIWGIGSQYAKFLISNGINTAKQLTEANNNWIKSNLTIVGLRTVNELRGISCIPMENIPPNKKGICTARSFGSSTADYNTILDAMANYAATCAAKLRKQNSCAGHISVFIQTNPFKPGTAQYNASKVVKLPIPTSYTPTLIKYAQIALNSIYIADFEYKKVGVMLTDIITANSIQSSLFEMNNQAKESKVMKAMDYLNKKYGMDKVRIAGQGFERKWKLRQEKLSPCYTTSWDGLITIKL